MKATQEQQEIISGVQQGKDMIINAFAGSGKTSVLIMIAEAYPERRGIYLAYNRSIADEARSKFPPHIQCITTHSLAYQAIGKHFKAKLQQRLTATKVLNYFNVDVVNRLF